MGMDAEDGARRDAGRPGCVPIGCLSAVVLVITFVALLQSCTPSLEVERVDLEDCMARLGWEGTRTGRLVEYDLGDRDEAEFERALRRCERGEG